jgi:hypothetical protein
MRELRLTFSAGDFGAVSQVLVEMGIAFHVEPMEAPAPEADAAVPAPAAQRRRPAKRTRKPGRKTAAQASEGGEAPVSAVSRLRAALTQNRVHGDHAGAAPGVDRDEPGDMPSHDERDV